MHILINMIEENKRIVIAPNLHTLLKIGAAKKGISMKEYIEELIKKDLGDNY